MSEVWNGTLWMLARAGTHVGRCSHTRFFTYTQESDDTGRRNLILHQLEPAEAKRRRSIFVYPLITSSMMPTFPPKQDLEVFT